jgi:hypothetical protein
MNAPRLCAVLLAAAMVPLGQLRAQQPTAGNAIRDMIIEDSLTPAKMQLRDYLTELRDTLTYIGSVQDRVARARAAKMTAVVLSQGWELSRRCLGGVQMLDVTTKRIAPMHTSDPRGDQALESYRAGMATLREDLRECAHFDSLALKEREVDQEKIEHIATAASDAVLRYEQVRDALLKLLGISLPIRGNIYH